MVDKKVSIVFPIYVPTEELRAMTDKNLSIAKEHAPAGVEWIIVETSSDYYRNEADIHIYEKVKTYPNISVNRGFKAVSGDFVVFLANDACVCPGWIDLMLDCFDYDDCGIGSLGNNEHNDEVEDRFHVGLPFFFSVCMLRRKDAWLDPQYTCAFDDTDLVFRLHLEGKNPYKNLRGHVKHNPHTTYGHSAGNRQEYERCRTYFLTKYKKFKDLPLYKTFGGI